MVRPLSLSDSVMRVSGVTTAIFLQLGEINLYRKVEPSVSQREVELEATPGAHPIAYPLVT